MVYRFKAREKNAGWRIDYFLVSEEYKEHLADAKIHTEVFGFRPLSGRIGSEVGRTEKYGIHDHL